jgi:hypothetical protein
MACNLIVVRKHRFRALYAVAKCHFGGQGDATPVTQGYKSPFGQISNIVL